MKAGDNPIRTVITGVGVVSPIGIGNDAFWKSLMEGRSGIGYLRAFRGDHLPTKSGRPNPRFRPGRLALAAKSCSRSCRGTSSLGRRRLHLAMNDARLAAARSIPTDWAFHSGPAGSRRHRKNSPTRRPRAPTRQAPSTFDRWGQQAMGEICPLWLLRQLPNMPACHVSIEFDARGPNNTITCRESSAFLRLAEAVGVIRARARPTA